MPRRARLQLCACLVGKSRNNLLLASVRTLNDAMRFIVSQNAVAMRAPSAEKSCDLTIGLIETQSTVDDIITVKQAGASSSSISFSV
jgi:hypothetical protein